MSTAVSQREKEGSMSRKAHNTTREVTWDANSTNLPLAARSTTPKAITMNCYADEDPTANAVNYGYGDDSISSGPSTALSNTADAILTSTFGDSSKDPYPPMPADRLARKQRLHGRRGGAGHSDLLKSAVLASMESQDSDSENECGRERSDSVTPAESVFVERPTSPRKRARFRAGGNDSSDDLLALKMASDLLSTMSVAQSPADEEEAPVVRRVSRQAPVRRISRRTSYDEKMKLTTGSAEGPQRNPELPL